VTDAAPRRRRHLLRWSLLALVAAAVALVAAAPLWLPWHVREHVMPAAAKRFGVRLETRAVTVTVDECRLRIEGLRILDGADPVIEAQVVDVDVTWRTLVGGPVVIEAGVVEGAAVRISVDEEGVTNLEKLSDRGGLSEPVGALSPPAAHVKRLEVRGGTVTVDDAPRDTSLVFRDVEGTMLDLQFHGRRDKELFGQLRVDATLEQPRRDAPLTVVAWETPTGREPTFVGHAVLTGLDLTAIPAYVDDSARALLGADELDLLASLDVQEGVIERGGIVGVIPGRPEPLVARFGGRWDAPTIAMEDSLARVLELPFRRLGVPGALIWSSGRSITGGAIGLVEHTLALDPVGAGGAVVGGVRGVVEAVGKGVMDTLAVIGNVLGITGQHHSEREVEKLHAEIRQALLAERREAAREWASRRGGRTVPEDPPALPYGLRPEDR
jgi:hypothetical protein